ncbi:MAG: hypothetical protein ACSHX8_04860 [Opitutaceae bacterium]
MLRIYQASVPVLLVIFVVLMGVSCRSTDPLDSQLVEACSIVQVIQRDDLSEVDSIAHFQTQVSVLESNAMLRGVARRLSNAEKAQLLPRDVAETKLVDYLQANRFIEPVFEDLQIRIHYKHSVSDIAARVANLFAYEMVDYNLKLNIGMTAVDHLEIRLEQQQKRVQELEEQLADYRKQHDIVDEEAVVVPREQLSLLNQGKQVPNPVRVKYDSLQKELKSHRKFLVALEERLDLEVALERERTQESGPVRIIQLATRSESLGSE